MSLRSAWNKRCPRGVGEASGEAVAEVVVTVIPFVVGREKGSTRRVDVQTVLSSSTLSVRT
ncbi:hypothetical protein GCM10010974_22510 [Brevibacterium sediminis]|uniref:Uncharacterized protein n=1 Tax=Brevibacterium sediminis TaxID=1857024 RepID=A0ABQ1MF94_9MICO|nr:hypothetical protein GCM10010974_22510 [Brevibacterium sediminis]